MSDDADDDTGYVMIRTATMPMMLLMLMMLTVGIWRGCPQEGLTRGKTVCEKGEGGIANCEDSCDCRW
jgi:hypothetical protein